tara:strand:+ start:160 stop:453 length:294 start_codon:yes stop_codon:yes gene_type:complete
LTKLKINGLMDNDKIRWKKIKCCCIKGDVEHSFPLIECTHCSCQQKEDSLPRNTFIVKVIKHDDKGKLVETKDKEIKEIKICRGEKLNEIIGWGWNQ